jgi:hypothetical protein
MEKLVKLIETVNQAPKFNFMLLSQAEQTMLQFYKIIDPFSLTAEKLRQEAGWPEIAAAAEKDAISYNKAAYRAIALLATALQLAWRRWHNDKGVNEPTNNATTGLVPGVIPGHWTQQPLSTKTISLTKPLD